MFAPDEARLVSSAFMKAVDHGHELPWDWERRGRMWAIACEKCGYAVLVDPSQQRIFGRAAVAPCPFGEK